MPICRRDYRKAADRCSEIGPQTHTMVQYILLAGARTAASPQMHRRYDMLQ